MDDRTNQAYNALPERLYVVLDGKVIFEVGLFKLKGTKVPTISGRFGTW